MTASAFDTMRSATVGSGASGPELSYRDTGPRAEHAGRTIVLLHSLGTDAKIWRAQVEGLAAYGRVLAVDSRGHGLSGWDGGVTIPDWVHDIGRLLDHADVGSACLVGLSMGGVQAMAYASEYPERVAALVVADSFAQLEPAVALGKIDSMTEQCERMGMADFADAYVADTFTTAPYPPGVTAVRDAIAGMRPEAYLASTRACFGARLNDRLAAIAAPTLVLWGECDQKAPRELSQQVAEAVPDARLQVIPEAGHLSNIENPCGFTSAVHSFLEALDGAAATSDRS